MTFKSNTAINRYGSIAAEIYDIDKPIGAMPDTAFHVERLAGVRGRILEPACGSGRTLVPLLEAGFDVAGFDTSAEMLERCRGRCAERGLTADLSQQGFDEFSYDEPFSAIVLPVASFTLIDDFERAMDVLRRFHAHLAQGGLLILDMPSLASMTPQEDDRRRWAAENGDLLTLEGRRTKSDWLSQRVEYDIRYERWREGALIACELEPMAQRYWGLEEFALALAAAGFEAISVVGGYDRSRAPRSRDRVLTFEAVRR